MAREWLEMGVACIWLALTREKMRSTPKEWGGADSDRSLLLHA
jgi:hypothetical protein